MWTSFRKSSVFLQFLLIINTVVASSRPSPQAYLGFAKVENELTQSDVEWNTPPHEDDTGHLIFDTTANLLKHWANAYYRNAHNVVPGVIKPGTLLFHGRTPSEPPVGADWLALDPEHAIQFSGRGGYGHLLTYAAARELRILYFDGSSAAKLTNGPMDSQDIIMYGHVVDDDGGSHGPMGGDRVRIEVLCEWGKKYNLDGFFRMEPNFELMQCDFADGIELVSNVPVIPVGRAAWLQQAMIESHPDMALSNVSDFDLDAQAPPGRQPIEPPAGWKGSLRDSEITGFWALEAGNWHNFHPVPGLELDYSRLISFYDPKYQSLVKARRGVERARHRLLNISDADVELFFSDLDEVLTRPETERGSGVDWASVIRHIVERHEDRLRWLSWLLKDVDANVQGFNATRTMIYVRQHILTMLAPYLSTSDMPSELRLHSPDASPSWLAAPMRRCRSTYTSRLPVGSMTPQEELLKSSVEQTVREICRTVGVIWTTAFDAESLATSSVVASSEEGDSAIMPLLRSWKAEVDRLTAWLGWSTSIQCNPACKEDEICTVPQWPYDIRTGYEDSTPHCVSTRPSTRAS